MRKAVRVFEAKKLSKPDGRSMIALISLKVISVEKAQRHLGFNGGIK